MQITIDEPIHSAKVIGTRDEVFYAAQTRMRELNQKKYLPYKDPKSPHYKDAGWFEAEVDRDQAERQALDAIQLPTAFGRLVWTYMDIRSRAYEKIYGPGSYPPLYDEDDMHPATLIFPVKGDAKDIGGIRVTFSPKGEARKLRCEDHGVSIRDLVSYMLPRPLAGEWGGNMTATARNALNLQQKLERARDFLVENLSYAEIGSIAIEPGLIGQNIGVKMMTKFFEYVVSNGGINGEQFFVAEATPASIVPILKGAQAAGLPCLVRMDAASVRTTSNGVVVPRMIVVLSHDKAFIDNMWHHKDNMWRHKNECMRYSETPNCVLPEDYLEHFHKVDKYLRKMAEKVDYWKTPNKSYDILKIDRENPHPWFPWIEKPETPVTRIPSLKAASFTCH